MEPRILLVGFGEPPRPERDAVMDYLERIFRANMDVEGIDDAATARERARELARRRAPGLLEEHEAIGGSPLQAHLRGHADGLAAELDDRGLAATTRVATQFYEPTIDDAVDELAGEGAQRVVVLPMYPLCGPSTTVAAIADVAAAVEARSGWAPEVVPIGGWHRHPGYNRLRAATVRETATDRGLDLAGDGVELVFSAHGTPTHYLEAGSRYDRYVREYCEVQAGLVGVESYTLGYQNHASRGVDWTEPAIEAAIEAVEADAVLLDPISFVHEQSETLFELDEELAAEAAASGLAFHRVPVPHDHDAFPAVLADLVEPAVAGFDDAYYGFRACQCASTPGTRCLCAPMAQ